MKRAISLFPLGYIFLNVPRNNAQHIVYHARAFKSDCFGFLPLLRLLSMFFSLSLCFPPYRIILEYLYNYCLLHLSAVLFCSLLKKLSKQHLCFVGKKGNVSVCICFVCGGSVHNSITVSVFSLCIFPLCVLVATQT